MEAVLISVPTVTGVTSAVVEKAMLSVEMAGVARILMSALLTVSTLASTWREASAASVTLVTLLMRTQCLAQVSVSIESDIIVANCCCFHRYRRVCDV